MVQIHFSIPIYMFRSTHKHTQMYAISFQIYYYIWLAFPNRELLTFSTLLSIYFILGFQFCIIWPFIYLSNEILSLDRNTTNNNNKIMMHLNYAWLWCTFACVDSVITTQKIRHFRIYDWFIYKSWNQLEPRQRLKMNNIILKWKKMLKSVLMFHFRKKCEEWKIMSKCSKETHLLRKKEGNWSESGKKCNISFGNFVGTVWNEGKKEQVEIQQFELTESEYLLWFDRKCLAFE